MIERGTGQAPTTAPSSLPGAVVAGRFARDPGHFAVVGTAEAAP